MTCKCDITQQKIDGIEKMLKAEGWGFVHRGAAIMLVKMTRDECRHKDTNHTYYCRDSACAAGCDKWEGRA